MNKSVYVGSGRRTPFGSFCGSLGSLTAAELGSAALTGSLQRAGVDPSRIEEVVFGCVIQAGQGQNIARQVALGAGLGTNVPAMTINKVCGSGLHAILHAFYAIQCTDKKLIATGGTESMTNAPYLLPKARAGYRMNHGEVLDAMIQDGLWDVYTNKHMGMCGDLCADKYDISRDDQDEYAIESYRRALRSWEEGFFSQSVAPVVISKKRKTVTVERDEDLDKYKGAEALRGLKPAFGPESTVTAGNASGINDGAAAALVFDESCLDLVGKTPSARILGSATVAMESDWFTIAPIYAIRKLCDQLNIKPAEVDLYEINEAFSLVAIVAIRELGLEHDRVNVSGGSVAIGHPIGATGARLVVDLIESMHRREKRLGIACLCIGGGEATAVALERCQ